MKATRDNFLQSDDYEVTWSTRDSRSIFLPFHFSSSEPVILIHEYITISLARLILVLRAGFNCDRSARNYFGFTKGTNVSIISHDIFYRTCTIIDSRNKKASFCLEFVELFVTRAEIDFFSWFKDHRFNEFDKNVGERMLR